MSGDIGSCANSIAGVQIAPYQQGGLSRQAVESMLRTASQQFRPEELAARGQRDAAAQLQHAAAAQVLRSPDTIDPIRREPLSLAIQVHISHPASDGQITKTARAFEAYLRGDHYADSPDTVAVSRALSL